MRRRNLIGLAAAFGVAVASWGGGAFAQEFAANNEQARAIRVAKTAGAIGEQADGLLGFVTGEADTATKQAVAEVNERRRAVYRDAAARNNVSVETAGSWSFEKVIEPNLLPGQFYRPKGSGWVRK
jgi:uncharacterized protein YdbL (DUF1318 family)